MIIKSDKNFVITSSKIFVNNIINQPYKNTNKKASIFFKNFNIPS